MCQEEHACCEEAEARVVYAQERVGETVGGGGPQVHVFLEKVALEESTNNCTGPVFVGLEEGIECSKYVEDKILLDGGCKKQTVFSDFSESVSNSVSDTEVQSGL